MIMNSIGISGFKSSLKEILRRIKESEGKSRADIMARNVDERLDRSLEQYEESIEETCKYILSKNPITVILEMNKKRKPKKKAKEAIEDEPDANIN